MKSFNKLFAAILCSLAFGAANAAVITVPQHIDLNPDHPVTAANPAGFRFDLNALLTAEGVSSDDILSAYLEIFLTDPGAGQERYAITVGSGASSQVVPGTGMNQVPNGQNETKVTINLAAALADLQDDGKLDVGIALTSAGDFSVTRGSLFASFEEPVDVPEPASAALLLVGLLGVQAARRRRA